jgi:hypothetical protein
MERWERAEAIRKFVAAAKAKADPLDPESDLSKWLKWALQYAAEIDPLRDPVTDLPKRRKMDYLPYNYPGDLE